MTNRLRINSLTDAALDATIPPMPDLSQTLHARFADAMAAAFGDAQRAADPIIRPAQNPKFGDYQANVAMSLAKTLGAKPRDVAQKIVDALKWDDLLAEAPTIAGPGFINLRLRADRLSEFAGAMAADRLLGMPPANPPRTVVIDYSGPNVAKEMHVGHLRSSIIGDAIARVLVFQGHRVIRQNHLGDWGTQFGMLIEHLRAQGIGGQTSAAISDLNAFYQQAKKRFDSEPAFADAARKRVVALQSGDAETLKMWHWLIEESQRHFNDVYHRLGVSLADTDVRGESFYNALLGPTADELKSKGLAVESDGALCVFPPGFQDQESKPLPVMVRKSDGGYGYDSTDLAALRFRVRDLNADRVIYVTDARQKQHFAMVFKVAEMAGWLNKEAKDERSPLPISLPGGEGIRVEHVPFGTVLGSDGKPFKTRSGETVKLSDLLDEAEERAAKVMMEKNPELAPDARARTARMIGIGAVKYADLVNDRIKDYVFDWDRMLAFDGNTAPYLVNAYVRICSIFRKALVQGIITQAHVPGAGEAQGLQTLSFGAAVRVGEPAERALVLRLLQWPAVIEGVAQSLEPHRLCGFLYELAAEYHQFYEHCPVLSASDDATRKSRLALSDLVARTLRMGLELLGIGVVEQM